MLWVQPGCGRSLLTGTKSGTGRWAGRWWPGEELSPRSPRALPAVGFGPSGLGHREPGKSHPAYHLGALLFKSLDWLGAGKQSSKCFYVAIFLQPPMPGTSCLAVPQLTSHVKGESEGSQERLSRCAEPGLARHELKEQGGCGDQVQREDTVWQGGAACYLALEGL